MTSSSPLNESHPFESPSTTVSRKLEAGKGLDLFSWIGFSEVEWQHLNVLIYFITFPMSTWQKSLNKEKLTHFCYFLFVYVLEILKATSDWLYMHQINYMEINHYDDLQKNFLQV